MADGQSANGVAHVRAVWHFQALVLKAGWLPEDVVVADAHPNHCLVHHAALRTGRPQALHKRPAAVHKIDGAGNKIGLGEKDDGPGHVFRCTHAFEQ